MLHHHKKHWLFHATMWVCAFCVLGAFGFVSWKFQNENKWLVQEVNRLTAENGNVKGELSMCAKKKMGLEKSVEGIVETEINADQQCEPIEGSCFADNCLFSVGPLSTSVAGIAKLTGYFTKQTREGKDCSTFVVTAGPTSLTTDLLQAQYNSKNEKGQLVLDIDPTILPVLEKQKLTSSKENSQVNIHIVRIKRDSGGTTPLCNPLVELLRVQ